MRQLIENTVRTISNVFILSVVLVAAFPRPSTAQWQTDGNRLCSANGYQSRCQLLSDGAGGAIVVWEDGRVAQNDDIYCSRFTGSGRLYPGWPTTGVPLCTAPGLQGGPAMTSDGNDGAIVAWTDGRSAGAYDIYAQRVGPNGYVDIGWPHDGVPLCVGTGVFPAIDHDGAGGAFAIWHDNRNTDYNRDIYAQHVSVTGTLSPGWPANGFGVNTSQRDDVDPTAISDGAGGAFVTWESSGASDLFSQRITASGEIAPGWPPDGLLISSAPSNQRNAVMTSDGAGGVIMAWYDARSDNGDIYAQRVTPSGTIAPGWATDGVAVCTAPSDQLPPSIIDVPDGVLIAWADHWASPVFVDGLTMPQVG